MATPINGDFTYYTATPLTNTDWANNFHQVVTYLTNGTYDITLNTLDLKNGLTIDAGGETITLGNLVVSAGNITATVGNIVAGGTITGTLGTDVVVTNSILAKNVTAAKIADNTITATQIANNTITATQLANKTVTASQIADTTITATKIANGAINDLQLAADAVGATKLGVNASYNGTITGYVDIPGVCFTGSKAVDSAAKNDLSSINGGLATTANGTSYFQHTLFIPNGATITEVIMYSSGNGTGGISTLTLISKANSNGNGTGLASLSKVGFSYAQTSSGAVTFVIDKASNSYYVQASVSGDGSTNYAIFYNVRITYTLTKPQAI